MPPGPAWKRRAPDCRHVTRGAWILKTETRETVSTNFKFFLPAEWKSRFLTRDDVPAAVDYVSNWTRSFPDEASARLFSAQIIGGDMSAANAGSPATPGIAAAAPSTSASAAAASATAPPQTVTKEIKVGMTALEVVDIMGRPEKQLTLGNTEKWIYSNLTVLLENGKVKDVEF